jgi:hypothetical protein
VLVPVLAAAAELVLVAVVVDVPDAAVLFDSDVDVEALADVAVETFVAAEAPAGDAEAAAVSFESFAGGMQSDAADAWPVLRPWAQKQLVHCSKMKRAVLASQPKGPEDLEQTNDDSAAAEMASDVLVLGVMPDEMVVAVCSVQRDADDLDERPKLVVVAEARYSEECGFWQQPKRAAHQDAEQYSPLLAAVEAVIVASRMEESRFHAADLP